MNKPPEPVYSYKNACLNVALKTAVWEHGRAPFRVMATLATPEEWTGYATAALPEPSLRKQHCFRRTVFAYVADHWLDCINDNPAAQAALLLNGIEHPNGAVAAAARAGFLMALLPPERQRKMSVRHLISKPDRLGAGLLKAALTPRQGVEANMQSLLAIATASLQAMIDDYDGLRQSRRPLPALSTGSKQLRLL